MVFLLVEASNTLDGHVICGRPDSLREKMYVSMELHGSRCNKPSGLLQRPTLSTVYRGTSILLLVCRARHHCVDIRAPHKPTSAPICRLLSLSFVDFQQNSSQVSSDCQVNLAFDSSWSMIEWDGFELPKSPCRIWCGCHGDKREQNLLPCFLQPTTLDMTQGKGSKGVTGGLPVDKLTF